MIAIPWFMIHVSGQVILGYSTIGITLLMFLFSPYIGVIVDRFSRKSILCSTQLICGVVVALVSLIVVLQGNIQTWNLIVISFIGQLYYSIHFPAFQAYIQEVFDDEQFKSINSVFEMANQLDTILAGAIASLLIDSSPPYFLLFIDAFSYFACFVLIWIIPYAPKQPEVESGQKVKWLSKLKQGFTYIKVRPTLFFFFLAIYMPFIVAMIGNYVIPIHLSITLKASSAVLAYFSMFYAAGAMLSGVLVSSIGLKWGNNTVVTIMMILTVISLGGMVLFSQTWLFLLFGIIEGIGNSGTKILRNTMMMNLIPNQLFGRVSSFYNTLGLFIRILLLLLFTELSEKVSSTFFLGSMLTLVTVSLLVVVLFKSVNSEDKRHLNEKDLFY